VEERPKGHLFWAPLTLNNQDPFAGVLVFDEAATIFGLAFGRDAPSLLAELTGSWDQKPFVQKAYETGTDVNAPLKVGMWIGTPFQRQVWQTLAGKELSTVSVLSYQKLAALVGRPLAVRAVASAVGKNPVSFLLPCHRIKRHSGALGGYRWGLQIKETLLLWEAQNTVLRKSDE
jgi:AraC family transcriptional regulator of adaptative response/methylated-DNA-[protein]-cysteine methyltransferase